MKYFIGFTAGLILGLITTVNITVKEELKHQGALWCYPNNHSHDLDKKLFIINNGKTKILIPCNE